MNKDGIKTYRIRSLAALFAIITGLLLMTYMIVAEDEPGAIPLILIVSGTLLYLYDRLRRRDRQDLNKNAQ